MMNMYEWKRTEIVVEDENKGPCNVTFFCHPDTKVYALRSVWDSWKHETRWEVWNLFTMQRIAFNFAEPNDAIRYVAAILNRHSDFADAPVDELLADLEEHMLAAKPLPDRWAVCVAKLHEIYAL